VTARYIIGDTRDVTATMPDGSVDLVLTSPPFLALRSYLPADHPDKWREIGSEATPAAFIDMLLALTAEWARVLAPHGTIAVELGDTYAGSGGAGGDYNAGGLRDGQAKAEGSAKFERHPGRDEWEAAHPIHRVSGTRGAPGGNGWPLAKSKALIPELYRIALAYGINPLTGAESPAGRWRVRNVVTWCRPNPPVGALGDKYRPATSDMVIACRSDKRWFDLDAVRTVNNPERMDEIGTASPYMQDTYENGSRSKPTNAPQHPAGAPPLDYWVIPPGGYPGSHFAVYPPELCIIPIESMCPRQVCRVCGEPRRRISGGTTYIDAKGRPHEPQQWGSGIAGGQGAHSLKPDGGITAVRLEGGWTDCGHDDYRPGIVFDPFAGSGTTLMVAEGHGRDSIGIDLDARNADLARERVGMFLEVEHHEGAAA
jgi:hypothetical protein